MKTILFLIIASFSLCISSPNLSAQHDVPVAYVVKSYKYGAEFIFEISFRLAGGEFGAGNILLKENISDVRFNYSIEKNDVEVKGSVPVSINDLSRILAIFSHSEVFSLPVNSESIEPGGMSLDDVSLFVQRVGPFGSKRILRRRGESVSVDYVVNEINSFFETISDRIDDKDKELIKPLLTP
jgi:hypothetical protein